MYSRGRQVDSHFKLSEAGTKWGHHEIPPMVDLAPSLGVAPGHFQLCSPGGAAQGTGSIRVKEGDEDQVIREST